MAQALYMSKKRRQMQLSNFPLNNETTDIHNRIITIIIYYFYYLNRSQLSIYYY